jgi:hypothetical protein
MSTDSEAASALREGIEALRSLAEYKLPPMLQRRMHELGANKEFLSPDQHAELVELVEFSLDRSVEKTKAMQALKRLREIAPQLFEAP